MLGIEFDCKLLMHSCIHECARLAGLRLHTLLRSRRFYSERQLINLYKGQVLSFVEYRTPGIIHAAPSALASIDHIQDRFLNQLYITASDAFMIFNLAPFQVRRDIAILGIIHRAVLGFGPAHFRRFIVFDYNVPFWTRHRYTRALIDPCQQPRPDYYLRSFFGYIGIYNLLPEFVIQSHSVKKFQSALQDIVKSLIRTGYPHWFYALNRHIPLHTSILPTVTAQGTLLARPRLQRR